MQRPVSVRDVMTRSYVGVSESDPVAGAAELMRNDGVESAVVLRGSDAVGMLHAADLIDLVADTTDPASTPVSAIMTETIVTVTADSDLETAMRAIAEHNAGHLLVTENDDIIGVLTEQDIVTAHAIRPAGLATDEPGTGPSNEAMDATRSTDDEFATQSVCEVCGSLAEALTDRNGQLVCTDCAEI